MQRLFEKPDVPNWVVDTDYPESQALQLWATPAGQPLLPSYTNRVQREPAQGRWLTYTGGGPAIVTESQVGRAWYGAASHYLTASIREIDYPFTFSCWFRPVYRASYYQTLVSVSNYGDGQFYSLRLLWYSSTTYRLEMYASFQDEPTEPSSRTADGAWHHACGVFASATERRLYFDRVLTATGTTERLMVANKPTYALVGANRVLSTGSFNSGYFDDARIFTRALSESEIAIVSGPNRWRSAWVPGRRVIVRFASSGETIGPIAAAATWPWTLAAPLDADGQIAAAATWPWTVTAAVDADGQIVAAGACLWSVGAALDADGQIGATAAWLWTAVAAIEADGQIEAAGAWAWTSVADAALFGELAADATWSWSASWAINADGQIEAAAAWAWILSADIDADGQITGGATWSWSVAADASVLGELGAAATWNWSASGVLDADGQITAAAAWAWSLAAELDADGQIAAAAAWAWSLSADASDAGELAAAAVWTWTVSGTLTVGATTVSPAAEIYTPHSVGDLWTAPAAREIYVPTIAGEVYAGQEV